MSDRRFTILITGQFPPTSQWIRQVPGNLALEFIPFIHLRPVEEPIIMERLDEISRLPMNAIFTSAESVRLLRSLISTSPPWTGWCTAGTTERLLRDWLGEKALVTAAPDAASLAELMVNARVGNAIFFCGSRRRDVLPGRLRAESIECEEIHLYESIETPQRIHFRFDAILFFSPSAAESFFSMNGLPPGIPVFVIGKTTGDAVKKHTTNPVIVSEKSDKIYLLRKAAEYANAHPIL